MKALHVHNMNTVIDMMQIFNMEHTLHLHPRPGGGRDLDANPRKRAGAALQSRRQAAASSSSRALDVADRALRIVERAQQG